MKKNDPPSLLDDPDLYEGGPPDQAFIDYLTGRASIDTGAVALDPEQSANPLRWVAALIRAHTSDNDKDLPKLAIAHDLEVAAQGYGDPRILPLKLPRTRKLKRGERRDQADADLMRQMLVLSVYAEHGRRKKQGSIIDLAMDNGFSEDQWRKWSSKTDKSLRARSRDAGMVVTYRSQHEPTPPSKWPGQVAIVHALAVASVKWAR